MKQIYPDFYPVFHCLAGACPDTCCKGWEIVVDDETMAFYRTVTGELGEKLKDAFIERDGEACFRLRDDGRCVLLTADGLCPLQAAFGERGLCHICASHPRFIEEYGAVQEITLSISCPEAARLLLEHPEPVAFLTKQTDESVDTPNELDPVLFFAVRSVRDTMLALAQARSHPVRDRLALILLLAARTQALLDDGRQDDVSPLCARFLTQEVQSRQLVRLRRMRRRGADFFPLWLMLRNMEHLTPEFPALLDSCVHALRPDAGFFKEYASRLENLSVYFLFRYVLKAAADGRLLERAASCVFHVIAVCRLFPHWSGQTPEDFRALCGLYSKEVEHSEENLELLSRAVRRGALRTQMLLSLL